MKHGFSTPSCVNTFKKTYFFISSRKYTCSNVGSCSDQVTSNSTLSVSSVGSGWLLLPVWHKLIYNNLCKSSRRLQCTVYSPYSADRNAGSLQLINPQSSDTSHIISAPKVCAVRANMHGLRVHRACVARDRRSTRVFPLWASFSPFDDTFPSTTESCDCMISIFR